MSHVTALTSPRIVPDLAQHVQPLRLSADSPADERFLLFRAVADLLRQMAKRAAVIVVIDDLHEADAPTLQLFGHLMHHDRPTSTMIVATQRPVPIDHPLEELLVREREGVERLALAGLDPQEVLELIEVVVGRSIGAEGRTAAR